MSGNAKSRPVHLNLDTSYLNLGALLRYLQQREFVGRVQVLLEEYEAEIFLDAGEAPRVRELNHATGQEATGEDALKRLLVRASEPGGIVSVYESAPEDVALMGRAPSATNAAVESAKEEASAPDEEEAAWQDLLSLSGEMIEAVERAALSEGADFARIFRAVRLEMGDDYPFLDPSTRRFEYERGAVRLQTRPGSNTYLLSLCEALRRVVEKIARGARERSVRERVALELAVLARRRQAQLARFKIAPQFERIAGTRVL